MKKNILLSICFVFITTFLFENCSNNDDNNSFKPIEKLLDFVSTFGGSLNESGQSIIKTSDGGYAILGHTQSMDGSIENKSNTSFDYWLLKFSSTNQLQWQKTYGGSDDDRGNDITQTTDGGYAILGYSKSNDEDTSENFGFNDFWVLKLDGSGNISWEKSLGFSGSDNGNAIIQTKDGGYLLTGVIDVSASNGQGNSKNSSTKHAGGDYWVIKLNANGEKLWSKFYGGTFTDTPYDLIETADKGFLIIGSSDSEDVDVKNNKGTYDFWVVKISEEGTLLWEKSFGGTQIDEAWGITASNDGNYLIVGDARSNDKDVSKNNGAADVFLIKITPEGTLIWQKTFGGTGFDNARSISKANDGGYLISGSSRSSDVDITENKGQNDALILKIDANANLEWHKTIGGSNVDIAYDVLELNDGSIIAVGETSSTDFDIEQNKGFTDLLIFKIK